MFGKVKRLRQNGKRLTDREIAQSEPADGMLRMAGHSWSMEHVLSVTPRNDNVSDSLLPPLINPRVVALHTGGMLLEGLERPQGDDGPAYLQEWSIRIEAS